VLIAPGFEPAALDVLRSKKNRVLLVQKATRFSNQQFRSLLNGVLAQDKDTFQEEASHLTCKTTAQPTAAQTDDLLFAVKVVKHAKSNTIVLAKNGQLVGIGCGHTSRIDALHHAIKKAAGFGCLFPFS